MRLHTFPLAAALVLGAVAGRPAVADDPPGGRSPEQVLKAAGLTRQGDSYLLAGELEAADLVKDHGQRAAQLWADWQREAAAMQRLQLDQARAAMQRQLSQLQRRGRGRGHRGYRGYQGRSRSTVNPGLRRDEAQQRSQLQKLNRDATAEQKKMLQDEQSYQQLVRSTMQGYEELAARPEIRDALRALNRGRHPKVALGPAAAYRDRVEQAMLADLAGKGLRSRDDGPFQPVEAQKYFREVYDANAAYAALQKSGTPADDPDRAALGRRAAELTAGLADLQKRCEALAEDPEVRDALQELNRLEGKERHRVGLGVDGQRATRILDLIAKGTARAGG